MLGDLYKSLNCYLCNPFSYLHLCACKYGRSKYWFGNAPNVPKYRHSYWCITYLTGDSSFGVV